MALQTFTAGQILTAAQMTTLQTNAYNQTVSTKTASYVLVAADVGTRIVMNAAGATTITVNTSLFSAGDTLFIQNIGAGTCTITAGTATVTTASSLALAQWGGGTLYFTSASAAIFFSGGPPAYGTATGGIGSPTSVTISGVNYQYLTFNATGTLTVTRAGFFDYLAVGGGSGCRDYTASGGGGGGGAGSLVQGSIYLSANQTITIGAGSSRAAWTVVKEAGTTSIGTLIYAPGQATTGSLETAPYVGSACGAVDANTPTTLTNGLGKSGGSGSATPSGGGGGGYITAGGNASTSTGGAGGNGYDVSAFIGGSTAYVAGGSGGGGTVTGGAAGNGGVAGTATTTPSNGGANTGSGGGGGKGTTTTGNGGSGVCYIRWKV